MGHSSRHTVRSRATAAVVVIVCSLVALAPAAAAGRPDAKRPRPATTITFSSGSDWRAYRVDPGTHPRPRDAIGAAQPVCLNGSFPPNCPPGAVVYGYQGFGWEPDLSAIPDAEWVWAPGVDGGTRPSSLASFYFAKQLHLPGRPTAATLYLAADDFAEVFVNGERVGSTGSTTDPALTAHSFITAFDVLPALRPGRNVVVVHAVNGPDSFAGCIDCTYAANPAAVVFGVTVTVTGCGDHDGERRECHDDDAD